MAADSTFPDRFELAVRVWLSGGGVERRTRDSLARSIGRTGGALSQWKATPDAPPAAAVRDVARQLGVDPGWLTFGSDSAAPVPAWWPAKWAEYQEEIAREREQAEKAAARTRAKPFRARPQPAKRAKGGG